MLIGEAAHQPATHPGYLGWVEGEILILGHPDGNGRETGQKGGTAELAPTGTQPTDHPGLMANSNLPHLHLCVKLLYQVPDQFPEIHPSFRSKIDDYLTAIIESFYGNQAHR